MASLSRGLRLALAQNAGASPKLASPAPRRLYSSAQIARPAQHRVIIAPRRTLYPSLNFQTQSRTLTSLPTRPTSSLAAKSTYATTTFDIGADSPSPPAPGSGTATHTPFSAPPPSRSIPDSEYIEEGPDLLPPHQPRIIVADPAKGRWAISSVHAYAMALIFNAMVFSFLIIDFLNDCFTYWGIRVSDEIGR